MNNLETATFAGGCFLCADAVFRMLNGVKSINPGYTREEQKKLSEESKTRIAGELNQSVMTRIIPFKNFFPADENHQDYFAKNPHVPYCQIVIKPKVEKVEKLFHEKLKNA